MGQDFPPERDRAPPALRYPLPGVVMVETPRQDKLAAILRPDQVEYSAGTSVWLRFFIDRRDSRINDVQVRESILHQHLRDVTERRLRIVIAYVVELPHRSDTHAYTLRSPDRTNP